MRARKHAPRIATFICETACNPDCALALHSSALQELPSVVEAALEHLMVTEPAAFAGVLAAAHEAPTASSSMAAGASTSAGAAGAAASDTGAGMHLHVFNLFLLGGLVLQ